MCLAPYLANKALSIECFNHTADALHIFDVLIHFWVTLGEKCLLARFLVLSLVNCSQIVLGFKCLMNFDGASALMCHFNFIIIWFVICMQPPWT